MLRTSSPPLNLAILGALALMACQDDVRSGPEGQVSIAVAPLNLAGITDAVYTLRVTNGAGGAGQVVWEKAGIRSTRYGDGGGSLAYVGTCDAATGTNTVTLTLTSLSDVDGPVAVGSYMNPTPVSREVACLDNRDVPVTFDITLARRANQGFFDVAVQFDDIFCSAKLDCETASGADLELLHDSGGARDMTVVMGFACTGSITGTPTFLYMDDPVITCGDPDVTSVIRVDPTGRGNVSLTTLPSVNPDGYLFAAAVYRGVEGFAGKAYWNVSFGLDEATFAALGPCTLSGRATASAGAWTQQQAGFALPPGSVYPVIDWSVMLSDAAGRRCHKHEVNQDGSGVVTNYLGYLPLLGGFTWGTDPIYLQHRYEPAASGGAGEVLSAGQPICTPSCAHGACVAPGTCDCAGTGYGGDACETPVCTAACLNGATCTAPDTCSCPAGFWDETCGSPCAAGACAGTMNCDQDTGDAISCDGGCAAGSYGPTCAEACAAVAHCDVTPTCTTDSDSVCGACASGYLPDGAGGCVECLDAGDCGDVAGDCHASACEAGVCVANALSAGAACGDPTVTECSGADTCDDAGTCLPNDAVAGATCGDPGSACVIQDTCDGGGACIDNGFASLGAACGDPTVTECTGADTCNGAGTCLPNHAALGAACGDPGSACVVQDTCDGAGACADNGFATAGAACGSPSDTDCDDPDSCDGAGTCLANPEPSTTVCRAAVDACDATETCDGAGSCPADAPAPNGTPCPNGVFCDGAETCTGGVCQDNADACDPATEECDEAGDTCDAVYASCVAALSAGQTTSGLYWLDPDGDGGTARAQYYCDMDPSHDGGGWMLATKLTQHVAFAGLPAETYNAYFRDALWIEGASDGAPATPEPAYDGYHVESVDWSDHLVAGRRYRLRQTFFKGTWASPVQPFDVTYGFTYNGFVSQNAATPATERAWQLDSRRVLADGTGLDAAPAPVWDLSDPYQIFWLPFSYIAEGAENGGLYTGCASYQFDPSGCNKSNVSQRRWGNAGIIGLAQDGQDPTPAWAPHGNAGPGYDVVYIHQATSVYGVTGQPMALLYWIREEACADDADCPSGICQPDDTCLPFQASCLELRDAGQTNSGTYGIDPDGPGGAAPFDAYCDMAGDGGGWTLVFRLNDEFNYDHDAADNVPPTPSKTKAKFASAVIDQISGQATGGGGSSYELRLDGPVTSTLMRASEPFYVEMNTWPVTVQYDCDRDGVYEKSKTWSSWLIDRVNADEGSSWIRDWVYPQNGQCNAWNGGNVMQYWHIGTTTPNTADKPIHATATGYSHAGNIAVWVRRDPPSSCLDLLHAGQTSSGDYVIDPDGIEGAVEPFTVYCDMTTDGGGWTLLAKVHRQTNGGASIPEPSGWLQTLRDPGSLADPTSYLDRLPGQASHGQARLGPLAGAATLSRFVLIAENDTAQRAAWYKVVDGGFWSWLTATPHAATTVCSDVAMTANCSSGDLINPVDGVAWFNGMSLTHHGYTAGGVIHMRHDENESPQYDALCSHTQDNDGNAWHDTGLTHWGNGLEIWLR